MRTWLRQVMGEYLKSRWFLLLFVSVFFCMGIFFGAVAARTVSLDQADHLTAYLNGFLEKTAGTPVSEQIYFRPAALNNLYIILAMYILGLTVVGIPLVLVAVFTRGFIMGFTVGFLLRTKALKGLVFAVISVMPQNILVVPAIILGGVTALSFSGLLVKSRFKSPAAGMKQPFGLYTAVMVALCVLTTAAGLIETYITPVLIKIAAVYIK